ncbi:importin subunit alpha-3-like [Panulirus ornatus]|uniref:importin subunit alpha-3-like n=1 Tax=Panulirus ornatus TaxID=150431 RepID=UPI003A881E3E
MAGGGSKAQIEVLLSSGGLQPLVTAVSKFDTRLEVSVTNGIKRILKETDGDNSVKLEIEECGGLEIIESILYHENTDVCANVAEILSYFQESDEENGTKNQEKEQALPEKASKYVADLTEE